MFRLCLLATVLFIAACASPVTKRIEIDKEAVKEEAKSQRELYVEKFLEDEMRLQSLTYQMGMAAAELCGERVNGFAGFTHANLHSWSKGYRASAKDAIGLSNEVVITTVVEDSPAADAGLRRGDIIVAIDGHRLGEGKKALKRTHKVLKDSLKSPTIAMTLRRDGQLLTRELTPVTACGSQLKLSLAPEVNAFADGNNVVVARGMLRFADSDLKLATVIAHEMAHNAMGHRDKQRKNYLFGYAIDAVAAAYGVNTRHMFRKFSTHAFSQAFEAEADYVGLYIMNAAGMPTDEAADFWRDMGAQHPGSIKSNYMGTHPGTAERYLALEKISQEIAQKVAMGVDVRPTGKSEEFIFDNDYGSALASDDQTLESVTAYFQQGRYGQALPGFQALAENGNATAAYFLATMLGDGLGTDQNLVSAGGWMLRAANGGNLEAQEDLPGIAQKLTDGDPDAAPSGQFLLGAAYWHGYGLDQDRERGRDLFRRSANQDYVPAQLELAGIHERGDGVLQSFDNSLQWYGRAAIGGDTYSLRKIGVILAKGYGSSEHRPIAYAILNSLAVDDDTEAAELRDSLAITLADDELRLGQRLSMEIHQGQLTALQALVP